MSANAVQDALEHQARQIEDLKKEVARAQNREEAAETRVRTHEIHLEEIRNKLALIVPLLDMEKVKAYRALDWLLKQSDRDDHWLD